MKNWHQVQLDPVFSKEGVDCYRLTGGDYLNQYYVVSEASTRKLMKYPEVVGFDVYSSLLPATEQTLAYLQQQGAITSANILSILRGALNFPLEEASHRQGIDVHDISFLSCERVFGEDGGIAGLDVRYRKLALVPGSTLMIGDIIASGETLIQCMKYVVNFYRESNTALRNIVIYTIGGTKGIPLLESLTREIREFWPDFEGFVTVYHEGIFCCYEKGDMGVAGINKADIDFIWRGGIVAPEFRRDVLDEQNPLLEKCTIYDGGARRYEINEHVHEVLEFWEAVLERADLIDMGLLLEEKLGHPLTDDFDAWVDAAHYGLLDQAELRQMYQQELDYVARVRDLSLADIARNRIDEFTTNMSRYMR